MNSTAKAGASPFAHLGRNAKAGAEDDTDEKKDAKKAKAEDEGDDTEGKARKATAEDDDKGDENKDESKGKKAKKADADGDEDDENDPDAKAARARERSRIRAIMVSEPGKANPVAAAHLATGTSMPRNQAIELLAAMQAGAPSAPADTATAPAPAAADALRSRMAEVPNAAVGSEGQRPAPNMAEMIVAAGKKRRGEA